MNTVKRVLLLAPRAREQGKNNAVVEELVWKDLWEHIFSGFAWLA